MFSYTDVSGLDAGAALRVLEDAQQVRRQAEVQEALAMVRVVKAYRHQLPADKVRLAAEGTGEVDDFACLELAAALRRSTESVTQQVVDLLNLEARLPRLWEATLACGVPLWLARRVARDTAPLSLARARWVDATVAPFVTRLGPSRLLRFVQALVVQADPAAADERWARRSGRRVELGVLSRDGLRDIYGWLTAADACFLDAALDQLSRILAAQGSTEDARERRATALGILATPARALAMIQQSVLQPALTGEPAQAPTGDVAPGAAAAGEDIGADACGARSPSACAGHTCGRVSVDPDRLLPEATLVVHLSEESLTVPGGLGRCDRLGPLTASQIRQLLGHCRVRVQPVYDPHHVVAVDAYEIPARVRRAVLARHPFEVFPYSAHRSDGCDLDHTRPWRQGRAGQTSTDNLGPLRRKTHRAKTHAGWELTQPEPGRFVWRSPLGRRYVVTPAGLTNSCTRPPGTQPWDDPLGGPLLPALPQTPRRRGARPARGTTRRHRARAVLRR